LASTTINISNYSDALIVLGTAGVVVPLVRRFGLSPVLGYLGAGALLGPLGLGTFNQKYPALFWFTISDAKNYEIALWFMAISGAILFALSRSPVGLILQASGQDAVQAGALGFNVTKHKLTAFIISAFFSGLAGALLVFYLGSASVGTFIDITVGVQIIIAVVIGGRRTILGAVLGSIFIIAMSEALRPVGDLANFIVFAMALFVVLTFPNGFFGLLTRSKETS